MRLPIPPVRADRHDPAARHQVDLLDRHLDTQDRRLERHRQVVADHDVEARELFVLVVGIDRRLVPLQNSAGAFDLEIRLLAAAIVETLAECLSRWLT
ncbi:MAG: hypothetical protein JWL58_824 [Streptosporangiaceae bacterium]|nr:hypothetical protein [Streptosporangiaceae bacterium]